MSYNGNPILYVALMATTTIALSILVVAPRSVPLFNMLFSWLKGDGTIGKQNETTAMWCLGGAAATLGIYIWAADTLNYRVTQWGSETPTDPTPGSGIFNDKTRFVLTSSAILMAGLCMDFLHTFMVDAPQVLKITEGFNMKRRSFLGTIKSRGVYMFRLAIFVTFILYTCIYFYDMRTGYDATVSTRSATYTYMLMAGIFLSVTIMASGYWFLSKEENLFEYLSANGEEITDLSNLDMKYGKGEKGNFVRKKNNEIAPLIPTTVSNIEAGKVVRGGVSYTILAIEKTVEGVTNIVFKLFPTTDYLERENFTFKSVVAYDLFSMDIMKNGIFTVPAVRTYGYFVKTNDIGPYKVPGFLPWIQIPVSAIAGFSILRFALLFVLFQSQETGILAWLIETLPPLLAAADFGFGHWLVFYSLNYIWYVSLSVLLPTNFLTSTNNHVFTREAFYTDSWNSTAALDDQQIKVLGNAEVLGAVGVGVSGFSIVWPLVISLLMCLGVVAMKAEKGLEDGIKGRIQGTMAPKRKRKIVVRR